MWQWLHSTKVEVEQLGITLLHLKQQKFNTHFWMPVISPVTVFVVISSGNACGYCKDASGKEIVQQPFVGLT